MPTFEQIQTEIGAMLSIPDEELSEEQRLAMDAYLDELASTEASKVDGFGQFIRLQSALAEACKEEAKRLAVKSKTAEARINFLKAKYIASMQGAGIKKIAGHAYTLSIRENESVAITAQVETLPTVYRKEKITVEPDKIAIRNALKGGVEIPGCTLGKTYSLQIR